MNRDLLKGKWKQLEGEVQKRWNKINRDDLSSVEGDYEKLLGLIQESYGKSRKEAKKEINKWSASV